MNFPQHREVVVVTGASAGVGRATAIAFARRGAAVALIARGLDGLNGAARDVEHAGGRALILPLDVADPAAVDAAAERIEAEFGPIDVWVNNAMTSVFSPIMRMRPEEYKRVTEVTYLGYVYGTLAALRRMIPRKQGVIVQVGSALCFRGIPLQSAYCGAKHAVQGFTESLRAELDHDGLGRCIRVPMVHLPAMNTPQFGWVLSRLPRKAQPVPPIYQPEVAADAITWVTRHHRHHLFVGFPTVKAVWGNRFAPKIADRILGRSGYRSQQTDEPENPDRPNNLWRPVPGDHGPHGDFDRRARTRSAYTWFTEHRYAAALISFGLAGVLLGMRCARRRQGAA